MPQQNKIYFSEFRNGEISIKREGREVSKLKRIYSFPFSTAQGLKKTDTYAFKSQRLRALMWDSFVLMSLFLYAFGTPLVFKAGFWYIGLFIVQGMFNWNPSLVQKMSIEFCVLPHRKFSTFICCRIMIRSFFKAGRLYILYCNRMLYATLVYKEWIQDDLKNLLDNVVL